MMCLIPWHKLYIADFEFVNWIHGDWWLGWVEEVPGANAQEITKEELLISLREAASDILKIRRIEARRQAVCNYEEIPLFI